VSLDSVTDPQPTRRVPAGIVVLTDREMEVLRLLTLGLTSKEIATALQVSVRTVEHHRARLSAKLSARGRTELIALAARQGGVARSAT
jgi:DNA-binding CsgD family transcriptional regulator